MTNLTKTPMNAPSDIKISSRIEIDGKEWECTNTATGLSKKLRLRELNGSNTIELTREHVQELWEDERAVITRHVKDAQTRALELHNLNPTERRNFERQCAGVTLMLESESKKRAYASFIDFCKQQNKSLLESAGVKPKPPQDIKTLNKWIREYRKYGDFICFIKKDHRTQYRPTHFPEEIEELVEKAIYLSYSTDRKPKMSKAFRSLVSMAKATFDLTEKEAKSVLPSYRTFARRIEKSDLFHVLEKRHGKLFLRRRTGYGKKTGYPPFIGGRVEVDCNRVDVMVYDEFLGRCYRPWLMVMIDSHTRCIIGWDLSMTAPSASKVARVLKMAIGADGYPYRCIPANIIVDNGSEFINKTLRDQCSVLGIRIQYAPPYTPKGKPVVERVFRTFNEIFFHQIPGTTFSNPQDRGDYDSEKNASYTLKKLNERWVQCLEVYHAQYHRGIENTPKQAWADVQAIPELAVETLPEREAKLFGMKTATCTISGNRVRYNNLFWTSPALVELNMNLQRKIAEKLPSRKESPKVLLRYNEDDLTYAYVSDPKDTHNPIMCDSVNESYQAGLTMDVHNYLMKDTRARKAILEDESEAFRIRAEFENLLEDDAVTGGKKTKRKRAQLADSAQRSRNAREQISGVIDTDDYLYSEYIDQEDVFNPEVDPDEDY